MNWAINKKLPIDKSEEKFLSWVSQAKEEYAKVGDDINLANNE